MNERFTVTAKLTPIDEDLTVRNLANTVPEEIPSVAVDGMVVVQ